MRPLLLTLVTLPASTVILAWTGSYDAFTVVLGLHLTLCRSRRCALLLGAGLALTAVEHGALIILALLLLAFGDVWGDRRVCVVAGAGLAGGGALLVCWLRIQVITYGRAYWLEHFGLRYFLRMAANSWFLLTLSLFGLLWPVVLTLIRNAPSGRRSLVTLCLLLPVAPMLVTEDQTRVFAILSAPTLVALVLSQLERDAHKLRCALLWLAGSSWLPGFFIWKGSPHLADWGPWSLVLR